MEVVGLRPGERQGARDIGWASTLAPTSKWTAGTLEGLPVQLARSFSLQFQDITKLHPDHGPQKVPHPIYRPRNLAEP